MSNAISVVNLSKKYLIRHEKRERYTSLREVISNKARRAYAGLTGQLSLMPMRDETQEEFWALKNVSLDVQEGDRIGVIGRNGAGKSTLLKLLSRITEPTKGSIRILGRVASLLEVGTGFHPELTGRENIFLNGAILGMRKAEIARKFDEIVAFAEVERFLDTPVKRYSSGMYVRLAFAVAAHLEPEILIVDEVLAVGDAAFQRKCFGKMESVSSDGRTVLFVSHNLSAVNLLCNRAVLLNHGSVEADGATDSVIDQYLMSTKRDIDNAQADIRYEPDNMKDGEILGIRVLRDNGKPSLHFDVMEPIEIEFDFALRSEFQNLMLSLHLWRGDNTLVFASLDSDYENSRGRKVLDHFPRAVGHYTGRIKIPAPVLNCGIFEIELILTPGPTRLDTRRNIYIEVSDSGSFLTFVTKSPRGGLLSSPLEWHVSKM